MGESGPDLNPTAVNPESGAVGTAQHLGVRLKQLQEYAKERDLDFLDYKTQWDFIIEELKTTENKAFQRVREANTRGEASRAWTLFFERPGVHERTLDKRARFADAAANAFGTDSPADTAIPKPDKDGVDRELPAWYNYGGGLADGGENAPGHGGEGGDFGGLGDAFGGLGLGDVTAGEALGAAIGGMVGGMPGAMAGAKLGGMFSKSDDSDDADDNSGGLFSGLSKSLSGIFSATPQSPSSSSPSVSSSGSTGFGGSSGGFGGAGSGPASDASSGHGASRGR